MDIKIDDEFKKIIPPLTAEEYAGLEESLLKDGCRDALVTWNGILLDGHNRYEICQKYGIPFKTKEINIEDRYDAVIWICKNQLSRRNLAPFSRIEITNTMKSAVAAKAKEKQRQRGIEVQKEWQREQNDLIKT